MSQTRLIVAAFCAVVVAAIGATSAFAGEITGNGKFTPVHDHIAASICSFSGREDGDPPGDPTPNQTQTPHHVWFGFDFFRRPEIPAPAVTRRRPLPERRS